MSKHPSLVKDLEQFLYTHAQNMPYKKQLLLIVQTWEQAYQDRITELERADNAHNRMENEGAPAQDANETEDIDYYFTRGTRYEGID